MRGCASRFAVVASAFSAFHFPRPSQLRFAVRVVRPMQADGFYHRETPRDIENLSCLSRTKFRIRTESNKFQRRVRNRPLRARNINSRRNVFRSGDTRSIIITMSDKCIIALMCLRYETNCNIITCDRSYSTLLAVSTSCWAVLIYGVCDAFRWARIKATDALDPSMFNSSGTKGGPENVKLHLSLNYLL